MNRQTPAHFVKPDVENANTPLVILSPGMAGERLRPTNGGGFAVRGYKTVGISSLEYFWREREPSKAAKDLTSIIDKYAGKPNVLLVGYSFGADVLPFVYDALSTDQRGA